MAKGTKTARSSPDLYALLIGINNYKNNPLAGCENDVDQVRTYLDNSFVKTQFAQIHTQELLNEQATKDNIVQAFKTHLGKAKKKDTVLFYFSGHGAREKTGYPVLREDEADGNIGGILCATFEGADQADLHRHVLSNKELRYLIRPLAMDAANETKSHVIAIFDCCNSGSNTRSVLEDEFPENSRQVSRKALRGRSLDQFIFMENPDIAAGLKKQQQTLDEVMPQGDHVMLAACREVELAWERKTEDNRQSGAFTTALIDVLRQHKGRISYHELYSRVLNRMKFSLSAAKGDKGQTPQVYVRSRNLNDRYNIFLTNKPNDQPSFGSVEYSDDEQEWRIDLGAFHGIPADQKTAATKLKVYPVGKQKQAVTATIKKVYPFYATLNFPATDKPVKGVPYRGELEGPGISPVSVFLKGETPVIAETRKLLETKLKESAGQLFKLASTEQEADYVLHAGKGVFSITRPFEEARPLVKRIYYTDARGNFEVSSTGIVYTCLRQIGRWSFLKNLEHTSQVLPASLIGKTAMYPVAFRLYRLNETDGTEQRVPSLPNESNRFIIEPEAAGKPVWVRLELVNYAPQILNCSLATMTGDFGFIVQRKDNLMKAPVLQLAAAEDGDGGHIATSRGLAPKSLSPEALAQIQEKKYVPIWLNPYIRDFNLQGESNYFKMIVSTKPLDAIETFHTERLGHPEKERNRSKDPDWGDAYQMEEPELPEVEWDVRTIEVYMPNLEYDPNQA